MSKYGVISGPYIPVFGLNMDNYGVNLRIQSKCKEIGTSNNSVFGHFSHSEKHNPNWPKIPDHSYQILTIGDSGYGKTNVFLNLINHGPGIDKIYWYAKNPYETKY